jgi:hypothetical protein
MPKGLLGYAQEQQGRPLQGVAGDLATATHAAATVTYAADTTGRSHVAYKIHWSYSADPTGGRLTVTDGATVIHDQDVTKGGPGFVEFSRPLAGTANTAMTVTLADGGAAVVGKVKVEHDTEAI